MKNLLSILAIGVLTSSLIPLENQTIVKQNNLLAPVEIYWNSNHSSVEISNVYASNTKGSTFTFRFIISIGKIDVSNYKSFSALDPNKESYSKVSWGNDAYWGQSMRKIEDYSVKASIPKREVLKNDIVNNSRISLLSIDEWDGLANLKAKHLVGFSHYFEISNSYLQVFGYQRVFVNLSFSGGAMWTNLGLGIKLYN